MIAALRSTWRRLPKPVKDRMMPVFRVLGLEYVVPFLGDYAAAHDLSRFAGNLPAIKAAYRRAEGPARQALAAELDAIIDSLVMKNSVKKTTHASRQASLLSRLLKSPEFRLTAKAIRVLDVPSSIGTNSLGIYQALAEVYQVAAYVMGDLYFHVEYDAERGCVYDGQGHLLQVKQGRRFFSVERPFASGEAFTPMARTAMLPLELASWYLRRKYEYSTARAYTRVPLLHPDVERLIESGVVRATTMDVFQPIAGRYDLIISFNLLIKSYFSPDRVAAGIANLTQSLDEGGLLVMGDTAAHTIWRKVGRDLVVLEKHGEF